VIRAVQEKAAKKEIEIADEFSEVDIEEDEVRERANTEWREFCQNLDMSQPTNRQTVRMLIIMGVQLRRLEKRMLDKTITSDDQASLLRTYDLVAKRYSEAAEDVSQLERQREDRNFVHTLSQAVERTREVRRDWEMNKTRFHMALEESALIKFMVELHKVDLQQTSPEVHERPGDINKRRAIYGVEEGIQRVEDRRKNIAAISRTAG
jgi:hypothetical protein